MSETFCNSAVELFHRKTSQFLRANRRFRIKKFESPIYLTIASHDECLQGVEAQHRAS